MPFPKQDPRLFNRATVETLNPNQMGVYGIFRQGQWIYVGKVDVRKRLLDHLNGENPCILRENPTHWVDEVTENMEGREKQLILELNPACNKKVG